MKIISKENIKLGRYCSIEYNIRFKYKYEISKEKKRKTKFI